MRALLIFCVVVAILGSIMVSPVGAEPDPNADAWNKPAAGTPSAAPPPAAASTLYKRLGGYDAIFAVTDDFLKRMYADPRLGRFFAGLGEDSRNRIRQHIVELLVVGAGGPGVYVGRDMSTSHKGLRITNADFDIAARLLTESLDRFKVAAREKREVLEWVASFRADIVESK